MKHTLTILIALFALFANAQTDGISYQAVIISNNPSEIPGVDLTGVALSEAEIEIRFTIINDAGATDFQETQATMTDTYGMINVIIGQGINTGGLLFNQINWDGTPKELVVEISQEGADFAEFSRQDLLFVPYVYHRNITATGTLDVDGATTLNNSLTVTGGSPTTLTGNLNVYGNTQLNGTLGVAQDATLASSLFVQGTQADVSGKLSVDGDFTANSKSKLNGQVTIRPNLYGDQTEYNDYALRIEGTNQGAAIKLGASPTSTNNFLTFMNSNGTALGRIEGQNITDFYNSYEYTYEELLYWFNYGFITAEGTATAFQGDLAEALLMAAQIVTYAVIYLDHLDYQQDNLGAYFSSGGADYAEWIERADVLEQFTQGEVVGIKDGKLVKQTQDVDHLKVISTAPIVLGNQPAEGKEQLFERVAFLGQVPVKVVGKVEQGDFILPSGNADGLAVAMKASAVPTERFDEIIGVAWENGRNNSVNMINMAIGLNHNDLADRLAEFETRLERLEALVNGDDTAISTPSEPSDVSRSATNGDIKVGMNEEEFNTWLDKNGEVFEIVMAEYRKRLAERGNDYSRFPDLAKVIDSPVETLREMYAGTHMPTIWQQVEDHYLNK